MRAKVNDELAEVSDEFDSKRLTWSQRSVKRLDKALPIAQNARQNLKNGDESYHDDIHGLHTGADDAVVGGETKMLPLFGPTETAGTTTGTQEDMSMPQSRTIAKAQPWKLMLMPQSRTIAKAQEWKLPPLRISSR